jgi:hypothetical protein
VCSPPGQLSAASVSTMLQTVRRSLKTGQLTQQGQPTSDHRQRLLKRMALLGVVTWAQVGGDEEQGHKGLAGVGEARKARQGALAHEEQHMWDKLAHAPPHTRASVLAIATRQYVAKLLELHHTATQVRAPITLHHILRRRSSYLRALGLDPVTKYHHTLNLHIFIRSAHYFPRIVGLARLPAFEWSWLRGVCICVVMCCGCSTVGGHVVVCLSP